MKSFKVLSRLLAAFGLAIMSPVSLSAAGATCDNATPISFPSVTSDGIQNVNDVDFYSFTVTNPGTYLFYTSGNNPDTYGTLYNSDCLTVIATDDNTKGDRDFQLKPILANGNYVLKINRGPGGNNGDYKLFAYDFSHTRDFSIAYKANETGGIVSTGNILLCSMSGGSCQNTATTNNGLTMSYIDIDGNTTTVNSSSADVNLSGATVLWAGLYWQGSNIPANFNETSAKTLKFKHENGNYVSISSDPSKFNYFKGMDSSGNTMNFYQGAADVTSIVNQYGTGKYFAADLHAGSGANSAYGFFGGWNLVVVYKNATKPFKNLTIFDGYKILDPDYGNQTSFTLSGFLTPTNTAIPIESEVSLFAAEGESYIGDSMTLTNPAGTAIAISNQGSYPNITDNIFDSSITYRNSNITTRNPSVAYTTGIDIDTFEIGKNSSGVEIIGHNQTSTTVNLTTNSDTYAPGMIAISTDIYQPNICYVENIFKGTTNISGTGAQVNQDDNLTVRVYLKNTGNEIASKVQVQHQFDSLFPYAVNSANYNNSNPTYQVIMPPSYTRTLATDSSGNDLYEYNTTSLLAKINLGVNANNGQGGDFNSSSSAVPTYAVFEYNATVKAVDNNYSNVYKASYVNTALGIDYSTNPITLSSCDGSINSFYGIGAVSILAIGFDARETSIALADDNRSITTKVTNKPISLNVVSLNTSGQLAPYTGIDNNRVYLFAVDTSMCSLPEVDRLAVINTKPRTTYVTFMQTNTNHIAPNFTETSVGKDKKIMMNFINWNQEFIDAAFNCSNSNTQAVLNGVPQCLNSDSKLAQVFPNLVAECLGGARPACQSNSYAAGGLPTAPYDNEFGCYQCLAGGAGAAVCSTDNFAIRPERLDVSSTNTHFPNLLRSAQDYNTTINAYNYNTTTNTLDYNVTNANTTFSLSSKMYDRNNIERNSTTTPAMSGTSSFAAGGFDMANGRSVKSGVAGNEVAGLTFSDVGKIDIHLEDRIWSAVDNDDTLQDCSTTGTYVCGDKNVTFIPEHFDFNELNITNNNGNPGSFTYLANEVGQMAGRIQTKIRALNKNNVVTQNFSLTPLWENPISVVSVVKKSTYLYPDANETNITTLAIGFGTGTDVNGTKTIAWNETNSSQYLRFNFRRDINLPQNSFDVNGSDLNISMTSHYVDPDNSVKTADITGSRLGSVLPGAGGSKFVFGRATPRDVRVFGSVPYSANAWYEIYNSSTLNGISMPASKNESMWFTNTLHTDITDGNGTVSQVPGGTLPNTTTYSNGVKTYNFNASATIPYGAKAHIDTDPWMWYGATVSPYLDPSAGNLDCLTHPCFNINVVPAVGATGSAKSTNEATKASKASTSGGGAWRSTSDYAPAIR